MMAALSSSHAWRLGDLVAGLAEPGPAKDRQVTALTLDSRSVCRGSLFLACAGERSHGLAFAEEAARRGATAILGEPSSQWPLQALDLIEARVGIPVLAVSDLARQASLLADRFYGEPSAHLDVIGVTGCRGTTTSVTHLLAQTLAGELSCGLIGDLGTGFVGDLRPEGGAAQDALTLQSTLAELRTRNADAVVLELHPRAFDQGLTTGVRFGHLLFIDPAHGDASTGNSLRATERLDAPGPARPWAIVNLDDPGHARVLDVLGPEVQVAAYGVQQASSLPQRCELWIRAKEIQPLPQGLRLAIASSLGEGELEVRLVGTRNASHLLAVLAVLLSRGLPLARALRRLAEVRGVPGRMESFGGDGAPLVVVDYAHTPDALEKALTDLRLHQGRRVITVFGCSGDRDRAKRPLMGAIAERLSDALILTDDNPGGDDGDAIIADILGGLARPDKVRVERQRGLAIRLAIALAGTGDAVLVAGKGHETTQDLGELKVHFSDRAQVVEALREWREGHH